MTVFAGATGAERRFPEGGGPVVAPGHATGIAHIRDTRTVGRIGVTALIHLEIVSTFAIGLGPVAGSLARPGAGFGGVMANAEANSYLLN
jgi:aerobic C4-dicarboxylate transport protein